jgi:hypothetical protein
LQKVCADRQLALLTELRYIATEVGLHEARAMPTEIRKWWISEMARERRSREGNEPNAAPDGRTIVRDVPRGPRR